MTLSELSDDDLLSSLRVICLDGRHLLARVVVHLAEIDTRELYIEAGYSSLFEFCLKELNMSEGEAYRRIAVARMVQEVPGIVPWIERGDIHLTGLLLFREHLSKTNFEAVLGECKGKRTFEVEEIVAKHFPKEDVKTTVRKLPRKKSEQPDSPAQDESSPPPSQPARPARPARAISPLAPDRYKFQFTGSQMFRDKVLEATDLMRHLEPSGDIVDVLEFALDQVLVLLRERFGGTGQPQQKPRASTDVGYVTRATRREVYVRDEGQCAFVGANGHRCESRSNLEYHHRHAKAQGGAGDASNIELRCRVHNLFAAKQDFGREYIEERIRSKQDRSRTKSDAEEAPGPAGPPLSKGAAEPAPSGHTLRSSNGGAVP